MSWADRIAYVCHDFEDAVATGIVTSDMLPAAVREQCGTRRSQWLGAFITDMITTGVTTGKIGMGSEAADALAAFRRCNYETIYLRQASVKQAQRVIAMLRSLVEFFADRPHAISSLDSRPDIGAGSPEALLAAVTYVGGMTDRFACRQAISQLGWASDRLPYGMNL